MKEYRIVSARERDYFAIMDSREIAVGEILRRNEAPGKDRMLVAPFVLEERKRNAGPKTWVEVPPSPQEIEDIRRLQRERMEVVSSENASRRQRI